MTGLLRVRWDGTTLSSHDHGGHQGRNRLTRLFFQRTIEHHLPAFEGVRFDVLVSTAERAEAALAHRGAGLPLLAYSTTEALQDVVLPIPDFLYMGWPETFVTTYEETTLQMTLSGLKPPVHGRLFWIGDADAHEARREMLWFGRQHPDLFEFVPMRWRLDGGPSPYLALPDHAKYKMLLDIGGRGYSRRLKMLFFTGRPLFVVERPEREFFHPFLQPYVDHIPIAGDFSNLVTWAQALRANDELCESLSRNAAAFAARHLTASAAMGHLRDVLLRVAA